MAAAVRESASTVWWLVVVDVEDNLVENGLLDDDLVEDCWVVWWIVWLKMVWWRIV